MFVDFSVRFGTAQRDVQTMNQIMAKGARTAGVAADAQERAAASTRKMGRSAKAAGRDVKTMDTRMKQSRATISTWIKTLLGVELARRAIRALLNTFLGFSQALNQVRAITNATDDQFARLTATARELGRTTQFTATDAANALAFLTRTGLDVDQAIGVLPGTLSLAAATVTDLATASDIATNVMKGFGLQVSDMTEVVDILAKTTTSGNVNILNLAEALAVVAPIARSAGQSLAETAALIAILGDNSIKGSQAGVSLRRGLINLRTGTGAAGNAIERLGLQIEDANGEFVGLSDIFRQFNEIDLTPTERATALFELFGARGLAAAEVLANQGVGAIDAFTKSIEDSAGTADRMQSQTMAGLVGATKQLTSATESLAISWGEALAPALTVIANVIRDFILPLFSALLGSIQLIGPSLFLVGTAVIAGFDKIAGGITALIGLAADKLGDFGQLVGRFISKIPGLSALGDEIAGISNNLETFGERTKTAGLNIITSAANDLEAALTAVGEETLEIIENLFGVAEATDAVVKKVQQLGDETDNLAQTVGVDLPQLDLTEFETQLGAVREQLRTALSLEADFAFEGAESALAVQRSLSELTESQREKVLGLVDAERDLAVVLANIAVTQAELAEAGADVDKQAEATAALVDLMAELGEKSREVERQLSGVAETGSRGLAEVNREADVTLRVLTRMARALGLLDAGLGGVLRSAAGVVKALGEIQRLQGGGKGATSFFGALGGAGGVAAGAGLLGAGIAAVTTVLGGLFAGNTEADRLRRENTEAIRELTTATGRMSQVLRESTGIQFANFEEALAILRDAAFGGGVQGGPATIRGLTAAQIQILIDAAEALGLTFTGFADNAAQLQEALEAIDFGALTEDFVSAMNVLQQRFALFDIEDPIDQLDAILALFEQFSDVPLPDFDLTTAAGRAALDQFVRDLFDAITGGAFDLAALGGLTTQQALDLLAQIESTLDTIEQDTVAAGDGTTDAFRRSAQITVAQGGRLIAIEDTQLVRLTQIRDLIAAGTQPIAPPPPPIGGGGNGGGPGGRETFVLDGDIVVPIQVSVSGSVDDADALAAQLSTAVITRIDEGLEELRIKKRRALGD